MLENLKSVLLYGDKRPASEYDEEPVEYCACCHSLALKNYGGGTEGWGGCYCKVCGSTETKVCSITEWLEEEKKIRRKR